MQPQLELSFDQSHPRPFHVSRRQRRVHQARWWFDRMRQVVDNALDRPESAPGRPEQIYFRTN